MCGILAIKRASGAVALPDLSVRMRLGLDAMVHRGPDDSGFWQARDGGVALGNTRLAIVGLTNGRQPLRNEHGTVVAVVNGELYGHEELRQTLEQAGHVFSTDSDSELLVHLYEEYGLDCLARLRGEFAFLLWDGAKRRLVAARDRFGIKPLHYMERAGEWLMASEVKAIVAAGGEARWNERAFLHCLTHQYLPPGETMFAGIRQIPPAHYLLVKDGRARLSSYWLPPFAAEGGDDVGQAEAADHVRCALIEAVQARLPGEVPFACTLSGGLDSSAVATIAARAVGRPVPCFSVRFDDVDYDEGTKVQADLAASEVALDLNEVRVGRADLASELERAVWFGEGLAINGQLVGKFMLSRAIRAAGYKVVLAGEGADEAFLGYAHLQFDYAQNGSPAELAALNAQFGVQRGVMLPAAETPIDWKPPDWLGMTPSFINAKLATGRKFLPLVAPSVREQLGRTDFLGRALEQIHQSGELAMNPAPARKSAWLWTRLALANYILRTLGDGAEMAHSVEARLPFLDHRLFELAVRLPVSACFRGAESKAILRDALRSVLPESVRLRPKHPFLAPPLLTGGNLKVREFVADTLRSEACRTNPFFDAKAVIAWGDRLLDASREEQTRLDPVLMFLLSSAFLQKGYRLSL